MLLHSLSSFSVSISETTDSGIKISTGFDLTDESDGATDPSGLTLTFTDGSKLDLIEAGNAIGTSYSICSWRKRRTRCYWKF